jgi:hypothetical protein
MIVHDTQGPSGQESFILWFFECILYSVLECDGSGSLWQVSRVPVHVAYAGFKL